MLDERAQRRRPPGIFRPYHRRALLLHRGEERLGYLSAPRRRHDRNAEKCRDGHARLSSRRWRRALGAAGAAARSDRPAPRLPEPAGLVNLFTSAARVTGRVASGGGRAQAEWDPLVLRAARGAANQASG